MSESTVSGSCLCGSVTYTATGEQKRFYHCHCQRCRKASGTGHASNLFIDGELIFNSGASRVKTFKLPDATRFANTFCTECGSRVPVFIADMQVVFIPAGSLDDEPTLQPQARIFSSSKAKWSCASGGLPEFAEYPE